MDPELLSSYADMVEDCGDRLNLAWLEVFLDRVRVRRQRLNTVGKRAELQRRVAALDEKLREARREWEIVLAMEKDLQ